MKNFTVILLACVLLVPVIGRAQTPFNAKGYIEAYYSYDFSKPAPGDRPFAFNHSRHNEFNINLAMLDLRYAADDMRARVALQTGTYAITNYSAEPILLQSIHEASAGFRIAEGFWVDAGVLGSHVGLESCVGRDNRTLTRSLAAEFSPYYESGLRLEFLPSAEWTVRILALNGWQNIRETNSDKAFGTQVQFAPSGSVLLNWSTFFGNEAPDSIESRMRIFNDLYAQLTLSDALKLAVVFDIGMQNEPETDETNTWYTGTLLLSYTLTPSVSIAARGEYFSDEDGVIMTANNMLSASLGLDWRPTDRVLARIEGRIYSSDKEAFSTSSGLEKSNSVITTSLGFSF